MWVAPSFLFSATARSDKFLSFNVIEWVQKELDVKGGRRSEKELQVGIEL